MEGASISKAKQRQITVNYLDLFSGTGGFAQGLVLAGFRFAKHYFSEIDKHAIANYQYRFPGACPLGDVTKIKAGQIGRPDIISFGSPCQDISLAGRRKGLSGSRSRLFFEAVRIIAEYKPRVFVFENVKGIFSSNKGKDFETVLQAFANVGLYDIQWQLLNTRWFLPQNRERLYLVGTLGKKARCQVFPIPGDSKADNESNEGQVAPTIVTSTGEMTNDGPCVLQRPKSLARRILDRLVKKLSFLKGRLRRLTPLECERLQGFPDEWTKYGSYEGEEKEIADGHRYEMLGNAVSVPVVKAIGLKLRCIFNSKEGKALGGIDELLTNLMNYPAEIKSSLPGAFSELNGASRLPENLRRFAEVVGRELQAKTKHNKRTIERLAATFGITDKTEVKELTELAIVNRARELAHSEGTIRERFDKIVELYYSQVNLSHRTSQSILLQQYSTPAPIGYLAGIFCEIDKLQFSGGFAFEPSAGNGQLTIAAKPERVYVNEIDKIRNRNLHSQGFADVTALDASKPFAGKQGIYQVVITNPPFGKLPAKLFYESYGISALEHVMALRALDTMAFYGKAAFIIGGHTRWDDKGRVQAGAQRIFFNYLYSRYNVVDVININGPKLYSRQGTGFDVRLILIAGRKKEPSGNAPVYDPARDKEVNTYDELFDRVIEAMSFKPAASPYQTHVKLYEKALALAEKYPSTILALRHEDDYLVFGKDALTIQQLTDLKISAEFLYKGKGITLLRIPFPEIDTTLSRVVRKGYRMAIVDELANPKDDKTVAMKKLEREAGELKLLLKQLGKTGHPGDSLQGAGNHRKIIPGNISKDVYLQYRSLRSEYAISHLILILLKNEANGEYETFDQDADRLNYMFNLPYTLFSLIDGRKVHGVSVTTTQLSMISAPLHKNGYQLLLHGTSASLGDLGAPYEPASQACIVLNTQVPDSMAFETSEAVKFVKKEVGGDMDNFVRHRLKYPTRKSLCSVLSAEQIDAVAMAIYNIEARGQGMIIGDQTGIGKGRVAAAMIRYAVMQRLKPVFLTEKANLFSDIYRDLSAIGSAHLKPFIINGRESKTDIKDEDGNVIYQTPPVNEQQDIISAREVPAGYDFILGTYSQFNSAEKKPEKPAFLRAIAPGNIFILDEAHNSSGSSNTGEYMQGVIHDTKGVVFLSATFAKRPDNMPIYAMKTAISDCNMTRDDLVNAINKGGVALQEVLSSQLVAEGQMIRRERSFEGVEVNYITLDHKAEEHEAISDNITKILRDVIAFQGTYINNMVEDLDKIAVAEGKEVEIREGTSKAGVDNLPYFSKVFQVINQMLFSIKAEEVAERAIARLKEGKKPVIAFASTMGSFIESMENSQGMPVSDGDTINTDFAEVLRKGLDGIMRYTVKDVDGNPVHENFSMSDLSAEGAREYQRILEKIGTVTTGISISPIDVIIKKIKEAGYTVAEVTGRKYEVQLNLKTGKGIVLSRKRINTNDAFRKFNNNEVDVLMINQSGSTGASAHAIPTAKVPAEQVKQRVMIVLQAELDISTEVQKRGRTNRTGQIFKPIYDYVISAIPAEKRLMMMLQKKLKSLDANTTSNQKQSTRILDVPDFLNKYGDKIVRDYLMENKDINELLDDPLYLKSATSEGSGNASALEDAAHKVSGRVAVLSTKMQQEFYNEISERYNDFVEYLKQVGEYDLEVEAMNLEAETTSSRVVKMGKGGESAFGDDSILETVKANVLKKPFTRSELDNLIREALKGRDPVEVQQEILKDYKIGIEERLAKEISEVNSKYDLLKMSIAGEKRVQKVLESQGQSAFQQLIAEREKELEEARQAQLQIVERGFENKRAFLVKALNFFYPGRLLSYPVETYVGGNELVPAAFLGVVIDKKKKNPYAPSAMKLRFAIANSSKYLAMPASYNEEILSIIGSSSDITQPGTEELLSTWEGYTKQNNVDRKTRHIITGNLLQAFSDFKGKLVSYTTITGKIKKGILLPENWNPGEQVQDQVTVPIIKALPLIKSIVQNGHIVTSNGISFFRQGDHYRIIVAASRSKGGEIYLDKKILELVEGNNFEKTADKMVAKLPVGNIDRFVEVLQANHSPSVTVHSSQVSDLRTDSPKYSNRKPILLPDEEKPQEVPDLKILELEAEALKLKLMLLAA